MLAREGLTVRDRAGGSGCRLPDNGASRWRVAVGSDGVNRVSYQLRGWQPWRVLDGQGEFNAGGDPITLVTPTGERAYRGRLRVGVTSTGDRVTVNVVDLESYLKGVVPLEIPALWSAEAVQAQAVAARTYASYERDAPAVRRPTSSATPGPARSTAGTTPSTPRPTGPSTPPPATSSPAAASRRSPSSARAAAAGPRPASMPYLPAQQDPYDGWSGNPVHAWSVKVDDGRLEQAWPAVGDLRRIAVTGRDGNGDWGGRVDRIALRGTGGKVVVSGDTFRAVLGLRSTG